MPTITASLLLFFLSTPANDDPVPDAALPDIKIDSLITQMRAAATDYDAGSISASFVRYWIHEKSADDPPPVVEIPGNMKFVTDGRRWHAHYSSKLPNLGSGKLSDDVWRAGFDGDHHYSWEDGEFTIGEDNLAMHSKSPRALFYIDDNHLPRPDSLGRWTVTGQETIGGYRCYKLTYRPTNEKWRTEVVVSPRQNYLPVRHHQFYNDQLSSMNELDELARTADGLWFPRRIKHAFGRDAETGRWSFHREFTIERFAASVSQEEEATFSMAVPINAGVRDFRTGINYRNDPWHPEVSKYLRDRFDWPPVEVTPLADLASYVDPQMEGKPAPELAVARWVQKGPVRWDQRRGKVTLLYFSTGSLIEPNPKWVNSLKQLYATYRPHGLELIAVVASSTKAEAIDQFIKELRLPFPVCHDGSGGDYGQTFDDFGLQTYVSPVLVDHQGQVHLVKSGEIAKQLAELLEAAGSEDVPKMDVGFAQEPPAMIRELTRAWHRWVRQAHGQGSITGIVRDAAGPLPLVKVNAVLKTQIIHGPEVVVGGTVIEFRDKTFVAETDDQGRFDLNGLCKGNYSLVFSLPGMAPARRAAVLVDENRQLRPLNVLMTARNPSDGDRPSAHATDYQRKQQLLGNSAHGLASTGKQWRRLQAEIEIIQFVANHPGVAESMIVASWSESAREAQTRVAEIIDSMCDKGWIVRRGLSHSATVHPELPSQQLLRHVAQDMANRMLGGSLKMSDEELSRLERITSRLQH